MLNYWIFVVNDWTSKSGRKYKGREIYDILMEDEVWGIGDNTPNRKNLAAGDKVAFYLAGSEGQKFLGTATLKTACYKFKRKDSYSEDTNIILKTWHNGIVFEDVEKFADPKELQDLANDLDFIVKKEIAPVYFQSGVRRITKPDFEVIQSDSVLSISKRGKAEGIEDESQFVLEKYLQDFIVSNWDKIDFGKKLKIYEDENGNNGVQFTTDIGYIDILAVDRKGDFVVIELKKGRESDKVVGQLLRYMGWIKKNLAKNGQKVRGVIICKENDEKMDYAISMIEGITIKHYSIDFRLL